MSESNNNSQKKENRIKTTKRIIAWIGIGALLLMYLGSLILALCGATFSNNLFGICLLGTFVVPILTFIVIWLYGRYNDKRVISDPENDIMSKN